VCVCVCAPNCVRSRNFNNEAVKFDLGCCATEKFYIYIIILV